MIKISHNDWINIGQSLYDSDPVEFIKQSNSAGMDKEALFGLLGGGMFGGGLMKKIKSLMGGGDGKTFGITALMKQIDKLTQTVSTAGMNVPSLAVAKSALQKAKQEMGQGAQAKEQEAKKQQAGATPAAGSMAAAGAAAGAAAPAAAATPAV